MTQREFIVGCVKIFGLVVLLFGVLRFVNHGLMAGTLYSTNLIIQKASEDGQIDGDDEFMYMSRHADFRNKIHFNLYHLPFDLVQICFGLYLCKREGRIVKFLLN